MKQRPAGLICEEPFRLFFPLAVLATAGGVALWPMLHHGLLSIYPGVMHARLMTVGLAGFLVGFLGTAFPRPIDAPPLRGVEVVIILGLWLASLAFHFLNRTAVGDGLFAAMMVLFVLSLALRWLVLGADTPPPGGPVALVGLLCGGLASGALAWREGLWMSPAEYRLSHLLLYQGMALLPLLGVAPYLAPRLVGHGSTHSLAASPVPPSGWWSRFLSCAAAGVAVQFSFVVEAAGHPRTGMAIRTGVILAYFLCATPLVRRARTLTTCGTAVRVAVLCTVAALAWAAVDPSRRIGILHLFFVSGLGLVMMGIGVRVVLGHAGRHELLAGKIPWLRVVIGLVLLAAATRASADFLPRIRVSHLDYAAAMWVVAALLWLGKLGRWFLVQEPGEDPGKCPKARNRTNESVPAVSAELPELGPGRSRGGDA